MASTINATTSGVTVTGSLSAGLNLLVSGSAAISIGSGGTTTISNLAGVNTLPSVVVSSTTTISAVAGNHYVLTAASLTTVTLPASPTISDTIYVTVANGLTTNVISRNGKNIQGLAENMTLDSPYASAQLRFTNDATEGWVLA